MSEPQKLTIKAKCQGVIRLLKIPKDVSYDAFYELLKNSFGVSNCQLQYSDEEGDSVELGSQDELQEAFKVGKNLSPLKINIITQENPTMSAMINKPSDRSNTTQRKLAVDKMNSEDSAASTYRSPNVLVEPLSSLTINEKPTPKPRPNRRRIGFYTSLCSDIVESEKGEDSQSSGKAKKKPKKEKSLRGSKYYASLADDIAAMKLGQPDQSQKERKEMKRRNPSRKNEMPAHELAKKQNMDEGVKQVKRDLSGVSHSDEEPPKWFEKVVDKMSQSVSSQVLGALNGTAGIATVNPVKAMRRECATHIHEGIRCDGCRQIIVGPRYKCGNCPNFDLCEECEIIEDIHEPSHVFLKLRYPGIGIGRRHGVMIPFLKDIIYKSKDVELAEEQDKRMKEVRKKLKQSAKKKREEQVGKKKADKKMKKLQKPGGSNSNDNLTCGYELLFLGDGSYPDGTEVTPGFEFTKCWKIRNTGTVAWNKETKLMYLYGGLRCMLSTAVELPHLEPGHEGTVMATFIAPPDIGEYISVWRATSSSLYGGINFGSKMWCKIKVVREEVPSDNDEIFVDANETSVSPMQESTHASVSKPDAEMLNEDSSSTTADPIFHAYTTQQSQGDEIGAAGVDNSENQATSSDVSLLECNELEWDTCVVDDDAPLIVNEDDEDYIDVISNASSDDFCVVPLPACFNPDIPLDFGPGPSVEAPMPLAQELETDVHVESPADQQAPSTDGQNAIGEFEEEQSEESLPTAEPEEDETVDPEDDDIRYIPITSDRPAVDSRDLPEPTTSVPINIEVRNAVMSDQRPLTMPGFDARSTISEPVAPQTASFERTPLIHGRLPASPPGRAVPVVQIQITESGVGRADSGPGSYEVEVATGGQGEWQAVRTQPPDVVHQISEEEETVTIQPRGATGASPQSTAQFASTFVTGTLKRALGTVTDTVTSFMTGKDTPSAVVYTSPNGSSDNVHVVHVVLPDITQPMAETRENEPDTRVMMEQLHEMGFCDRQLNERLLRKHNMDVSKVVVELLRVNDNDWSAARH